MRKIAASAAAAVAQVWMLISPLLAQPEANTLLDEVKRAYRETRQYSADVHFAIEQQRGRWHTLQEAEIPIAFDRDARQLLIDRPDMRVLIGGNAMKLESANIPGRYLDAPLPAADAPVGPGAPPITYQALVAQVAYLGDPPFPGVAFLLEADPVAALTMGAAKEVETLPPAEGDGLARPRLRFAMMGQTFTLTIDPGTKLIAHALIEADPKMFGGADAEDAEGGTPDFMRWSFEHRLTAHNQPLAAGTFAFEPGNRVAAASLQELTAPPDAAQMQRMQGAKLEGKPAPTLQTQTLAGDAFDLAQPPKKVVVLDFWATWCGPCEGGLAEMQKVHEWAQREGKDVAIYTVNLAERPDQIMPYWEGHGFSMPVLLDPRGEIATAWGVDSIPASFIIEGGVIRRAHVGFAPGQGEVIKAEIEALLAGPEAPAAAP